MTGDYGTDVDSDLVCIPFTLQRNFKKGRASITVPYIWVERSGEVTVFRGVPEGGVETDADRSESGLGDIVLDGTYYAVYPGQLADWAPGIDLSGDIKLPTADEDKGLGSGEVDVSGEIGLYRWLRSDLIVFGDWKYIFIGEPSGRDFDNQIIYDLGFGYKTSEKWLHSFLIEERTALSENGEDSVSAIYAPSYDIRENLDCFASLEIGLSDGAPDYSVSIGAEYGF